MQYTENYSMNKPQFGENALVTKLNENADTLDTLIYNTRQMQADTYDSTQTYNTGDLVSYNSALYICLADNVTGAWDSTKWSATTLAEQVELAKQSGGESALADLEDVNITNPSEGQILTYDDTNGEWVNTDMPDTAVTKEATGNPIELTDAASAPMVKCVTQITGYQQGSGTPSPDNVRPITAYTEGEIEVRGRNLLETTATTSTVAGITYTPQSDGSIKYSGTASGASEYVINDHVPLKVSMGTVILSGLANTDNLLWNSFYLYDENGTNIGSVTVTGKADKTIDLSNYTGLSYGRIAVKRNANIQCSGTIYPMIRYASVSDSTWEPYIAPTTHTTTYPSAIYRGSEDVVNGEVTSDMSLIDLGSLNWQYNSTAKTFYVLLPLSKNYTASQIANAISDHFNVVSNDTLTNDIALDSSFSIHTTGTTANWFNVRWLQYDNAITFKTAVTGFYLAYELATPTTSSVTPTNLPIKSLSGYNHIESSTGDMEVEYITEGYQPLVDLIQSSNGHTYSTQEQVVGKWIDGKTLYEKTLTVTSPTATTVGVCDAYKVGELTGIDVAMFKTGVFIDATNHRNYGLSYDRYYSNTDKIIPEVYVDAQTNTMYAYVTCMNSAGFTASEITITLRYTKSTTTRSLNTPLTSQKAQIEPLIAEEEEVPTEEEKAVNEEENNDER